MSSIGESEVVWIGLGSNVGETIDQVDQAIGMLNDDPAMKITARSSLYQTAPMDYLDQPDFINAVVRGLCRLNPNELLELLLEIEKRFGRRRGIHRFGPRSLDLDLLIYGDRVQDTPALTLPHPRMHERLFVLEPLSEIEEDMTIPGRGRLTDLRRACCGQRVNRLDNVAASRDAPDD